MPGMDRANTPLAAGCVPAADILRQPSAMDRICICVDGESFRHSICGLFPEFKRSDYLPKKADLLLDVLYFLPALREMALQEMQRKR